MALVAVQRASGKESGNCPVGGKGKGIPGRGDCTNEIWGLANPRIGRVYKFKDTPMNCGLRSSKCDCHERQRKAQNLFQIKRDNTNQVQ
jgi:hypothetical protein